MDALTLMVLAEHQPRAQVYLDMWGARDDAPRSLTFCAACASRRRLLWWERGYEVASQGDALNTCCICSTNMVYADLNPV